MLNFVDLPADLSGMLPLSVRAGFVEACANPRFRGCSCKPGLAPAGDLLFFASPKKPKEKKGDPMVWVPCAALRGNLRCSAKAGSRSNSLSAQTIASPDPLLPALLGPARRVVGTDTGRPDARSASGRSPNPFPLPTPSACAEERRSSRIRASDCLSVASSSSTPAGPSTAGCPRSASEGGRRQRGRLFFAYFLLAKQKKVSSRRATPGLLADHKISNKSPDTAPSTNHQGGKC
jgi:hypothetical protein